MDFINVNILSRDNYEHGLKIEEALFINDLKLTLNNQKQSYLVNVFVQTYII